MKRDIEKVRERERGGEKEGEKEMDRRFVKPVVFIKPIERDVRERDYNKTRPLPADRSEDSHTR